MANSTILINRNVLKPMSHEVLTREFRFFDSLIGQWCIFPTYSKSSNEMLSEESR